MPFNKANFKLAVIGAGQMGSGIAQVFACKGVPVCLIDSSQEQLICSKKNINSSVERMIKKGRLQEVEQKISFSQDLQVAEDSNLIIEAVSEVESLKMKIFFELDKIVKSDAIFATNTSSISIARLAKATKRPEKFIGIHFMNPVPIMKLVEVITTLNTKSSIKEDVTNIISFLEKEIVFSRDFPGFIVNRVLMPMINEAFKALLEGVASASDIDKAMKLGTNQAMGPLALADFIGLDTCLAIMEVLYAGFSDSRYSPSPLLRNYVETGRLGRKTKQGVYCY